MTSIKDKIVVLKELCKSLNDNELKPVVNTIVEILDKLCDEIADLHEGQDELYDHIYDLEDAIDMDYMEDVGTLDDEEEDDDTLDEMGGMTGEYVIECPGCSEEIYLDENILDGMHEIKCSRCNTDIELEVNRFDKPSDYEE